MTPRVLLFAFVLFVLLSPAEANAAGSCTVLYRINGSFQVTDTYRGKGDTTLTDPPGSLVIEFSQDREGRVADGKVKVLHFAMFERFTIKAFINVASEVHHFAPACNGETDPAWRLPTDPGFPKACEYRGGKRAVAIGELSTERNEIAWARCNAASTYWSKDKKAYVPDDKSRGRGCLENLHAVGNVNCDGRLACRFGGLTPGDNPQYDVWDQPLIHGPEASGENRVIVSPDLSTIRTPTGGDEGGFQSYNLPNDAPSRTWFSWVATRDDSSRFTTCP